MAKGLNQLMIAEEKIMDKIYVIRDRKVMLDSDLAELYKVETKQLKRQVRRNIDRFPEDFMFELTSQEYESLRCQIGTLEKGQHSKYLPMAFTEQGVAMLSSVLKSPIAIEVNIQIIRVFTKMREMLLSNKDVLIKLEQVEKELIQHDHRMSGVEGDIQVVFGALKELLNPPQEPRERIGFRRQGETS